MQKLSRPSRNIPKSSENVFVFQCKQFKVGLGHLVLGRKSHPVEKNKDIIALGTYSTMSAWSRAQFKSGDGTFRMTVKSFYQV